MKKYVSHRDIKFDVCAKPTKTSPKSQVTHVTCLHWTRNRLYNILCTQILHIDSPFQKYTILKKIIITPILCLLASSLYLCSFSSSDCISEGSTSVSSSLLYLSSLGATVIVDLIALSSLPSLCVHYNIYCTGISMCDSTFAKKYQKKHELSCIAL